MYGTGDRQPADSIAMFAPQGKGVEYRLLVAKKEGPAGEQVLQVFFGNR